MVVPFVAGLDGEVVHARLEAFEGVAFLGAGDLGGRLVGDVGAAPEGEFQRISAYVDSTGLFTVDTAWSSAPAAGDTYAFTSDLYPLRSMVRLANAGLRKLGDITLVDTTTLDSASNQTEYSVAVGQKRFPPRLVSYQGKTGDANDNRWIDIYNWEFIPETPGTTGLLILPQLVNARDIRIIYDDIHPALNAFDDVVSETIHPSVAFAAVLERALSYQNTRLAGTDRFLLSRLNEAKAELNRAQIINPIWKPARVSKLNTSRHYHDVGEPDKVRLGHHHHSGGY